MFFSAVDVTLSVTPESTCSSPDELEDSKIIAAGGGDLKERSCDSLVMCIVTTLNQGLRNGGGIGDILRAPSSKVELKNKRLLLSTVFLFALYRR